MWMYYETDGDSGFYGIELFSTELYANKYKEHKHDPYGAIVEIEVDRKVAELKIENVKCPECDGPMVSRKGQYGIFWGCKKYPNCRGTRDNLGRSKAERDAEREANKEVEPSAVDRINENDKYRFRRE